MLDVPVLFDVGSERSFITDELVKRLGIKVKRKEPITIDGFGGVKVMHGESARSRVKLRCVDGRFITITVNSVPELTGEIPVAELTKQDFISYVQHSVTSSVAEDH
ncbi:unnamed protein product [Anisakis simplex]|uniref:DUF1758 domain-containing protein n=1 Tax=Anisakis simplex TaxID=6269 RepID=A0A0M3K0J6_ANISI|nr:unnamed protein product [Anisakis simplex]